MSTIDLNNLTGTESLDELDAALEALEIGNGGEPDTHTNADGKQAENAANTETDVKTDSSTAAELQAKTEGGSADKGKADASAQTDTSTETGKVIASKNGQHVIPYEVLEQERRDKQALQEQVQQLEKAAAERAKLQKLLEANGISADADPDDLSVEQIEQLAEDFPEIGKALTGIVKKLNKFEQADATKQAETQASNPLQAALQATPDLVTWQNSDPDRMAFAVSVDERLQSDPAWKDKSLQERFAEAARRTRVAFGDEQAPAADSKASDKKEPEVRQRDAIPASPSDIGQSVQHAATGIEKYQSMTPEQLNAAMAGMTPAQIEALLAEADL